MEIEWRCALLSGLRAQSQDLKFIQGIRNWIYLSDDTLFLVWMNNSQKLSFFLSTVQETVRNLIQLMVKMMWNKIVPVRYSLSFQWWSFKQYIHNMNRSTTTQQVKIVQLFRNINSVKTVYGILREDSQKSSKIWRNYWR